MKKISGEMTKPTVPRGPYKKRRPKLPEGIKLRKEPQDRVIGRKLGHTPLYGPERTQPYQSQYARYQKALTLEPAAVIEPPEVPATTYKYESKRSPTFFWDVTANTGGYGGDGDFLCTCPDFMKSQGVILHSTSESERVPRSWQASDAGALVECKHIIATKIYLGVDVEVPIDIPIF
jgi:hypothetical protein